MSGYRKNSKWNDLNELRCLLAFKKLEESGFPRNMLTVLAQEISKVSGLSIGSVKAKIGNYKSVAGITGHSNASSQTIFIYKKYGHLNSGQIQDILANGIF
jgi:hypothetical protein